MCTRVQSAANNTKVLVSRMMLLSVVSSEKSPDSPKTSGSGSFVIYDSPAAKKQNKKPLLTHAWSTINAGGR